jgi:GAF domain-containing protein
MTNPENYFKTFCRISKAFGTTIEKSDLLELIVTSAIETMHGKAACLFLADQAKDIFIPVAQSGLSGNYLHAKPLKAKKLVGALVNEGHLTFRDATSDPRLEHHDLKKAEGIASILSVPIRVKDKTIGILSLYTAETRDFETREIEFLSALADQGGMAIENARLFERVNRNAKLFHDLSTKINATLNIKAILQALTEETGRALGMKGVTTRLLNEKTGELELVGAYGLSDKFLNKGPVSAEKNMMEALKGRTVIIDDVANDERIQYPKEVVEEGIVSMLCVPIKSRDAVVGVMRLCSGAARRYPPDLIMTLEALAHTGALAIQNASLYLRLKEDMDSLEKDAWAYRSFF